MILIRKEDRFRLITQVDHAHFAAALAALWRSDELPEHPRRDEILFALREHDNGWQEADSAPSIAPDTGHPRDFLGIELETRIEIWQRGAQRFRTTHPWESLLIARHALTLLAGTSDDRWSAVAEEFREFEATTLEALGRTEGELELDYPWIHRLDALSLAACGAFGGSVDRPEIRAISEDGILALAPFPLAGATTFRLPYREIDARRYKSDLDLATELATARWQRMEIQVRGI